MLMLGHGVDMWVVVVMAYVCALPGVLVCGVLLCWGVRRAEWARMWAGIATLGWCAAFPAVFLLMAAVTKGELGWAVLGCSVVTSGLLWGATGWAGVVWGVAGGCALSCGAWLLSGRSVESPVGLAGLSLVWSLPVGVALVVWGRRAGRVVALGRCRSCGYDVRGLRSAVCPECGVAVIG